jgi:hypothetical protein
VISYALTCESGHAFDSWFPDSAAYDKQVKRRLVTCPVCGSHKVEKAIMAPRLTRTDKRAAPREPAPAAAPPSEPMPVASGPEPTTQVAMMSPQEREFRAKLKELRDHIVRNSDYVGQKFPEEARRMHYGESERRSIYGEASAEDATALAEEGIEFHHLPRLPDDRN